LPDIPDNEPKVLPARPVCGAVQFLQRESEQMSQASKKRRKTEKSIKMQIISGESKMTSPNILETQALQTRWGNSKNCFAFKEWLVKKGILAEIVTPPTGANVNNRR
jgi:hypothetical protein